MFGPETITVCERIRRLYAAAVRAGDAATAAELREVYGGAKRMNRRLQRLAHGVEILERKEQQPAYWDWQLDCVQAKTLGQTPPSPPDL